MKETVLGEGFFVSHPLVVKAAQDANAATTSAQPAATNKAEIEEAFQNGATVADAEKLLEEVAKTKDKAVDAITNKSLTPEEKAELKKAEDKKELPNTGGKDNVAVASLGFLGLLLDALPFVKRKN